MMFFMDHDLEDMYFVIAMKEIEEGKKRKWSGSQVVAFVHSLN
jgi:hypothetical protein